MARSIFPEYRECRLCPRACGKDRDSGEKGHCGQSSTLRISSIGPHFGEEPPISGARGSGTIFFTGCSTGCFFCQNYQISRKGMGRDYSPAEFLKSVKSLVRSGVHNLNFVTPDHFWPHIKRLIQDLKHENVRIPFLMNGSGYHKEETVLDMAGYCDIFMPDFKFSDPALSRFCMGRDDYPETVIKALEIMVEKKGFLDTWFDSETGQCPPARKGVLVRHLILPGHADNSKNALKMLRERLGKYIPISLMSQYHPTGYCQGRKAFERRISRSEFERVFEMAVSLGFENLFYQVPGGGSEFLPDFSKKEPFKGNRAQ